MWTKRKTDVRRSLLVEGIHGRGSPVYQSWNMSDKIEGIGSAKERRSSHL